MYAKFTNQKISELKTAIREYLGSTQDPSYKGLAEHIERLGIKHPNRPSWREKDAYNFCYIKKCLINPKKSRAKTSVVSNVMPSALAYKKSSDMVDVAEIVLCSSISKEQKQKVLSATFGGQ